MPQDLTLANRYQIIRPLAEGGFGKTFLACDRHLPGSPQCVIKQLSLANQNSDTLKTAQRLFNLEAETLYLLGTHPQIPALLAHFEQGGEFYLVQEYVPGALLQVELDKVGSQATACYRAYQLLKELLTVLAFVHERNVIHRDIKPTNLICCSSDGRLVLIDFGAVKVLDKVLKGAAPLTVAIGSSGYMAPEQQAGYPCFASDLYAVGVIGLQALTGLTPDELPRDRATGRLVCEDIGALCGDVGLGAFLARLVRFDPGDRYADAAMALRAFDELGGARPDLMPGSLPKTTLSGMVGDGEMVGGAHPTGFPVTSLDFPVILSHDRLLSAADCRNRQALKSKVHRFWIQGVLNHSLHDQVLLTLGLEERTNALALPWNVSWQDADKPPQILDVGTRVFDVFQQLGEGRSLLILGEPGAGKTTTLLTLARDLLQQSDTTGRIPAIFNLSSWTGGPIEQWLIGELNSKYQIPRAIGQAWVTQQQLLLLLDGLDEVRADRQDSCAAAINQFHQNYGPELVVCCRIRDYEALSLRLGFQSALMVRSLTHEQIWQYLNQSTAGLTGLKSLLEQSTRQPIEPHDLANPSLLDLARSPLILNIMALTYQGISADEISVGLTFTQGENYTHQLFSAYVERMFQRRGLGLASAPYSKQQTVRWLHVLATRLTQTSQTVFLIERMQPDWLTSRAGRWAFGTLVWASFIVCATLIGLQVISPQEVPLAVVVCGALFVRIFGVYRIVPAETLRWSWQKASRSLLVGLTAGPLIGWALKVGFVHIFGDGQCVWRSVCFRHTSLLGVAFGAVLGITYGVIRGLSGDRIATITQPNQGIRQSAKNAILFAAVASLPPFLTASFLSHTSATFWTAAGLSFGLALGGGEACIKHGILRLILFCQGRIPWNYARFLDYAADRIFLQKVGGGYIFVHRLLLEHFATVPFKQSR